MKVDLNQLREYDLRKYSYQDTLNVIAELERNFIFNITINFSPSLEISETYYSFAIIIFNRIEGNEFPEITPSTPIRILDVLGEELKNKIKQTNEKIYIQNEVKQKEKIYQLSRLTNILVGFKSSFESGRMLQTASKLNNERIGVSEEIIKMRKDMASSMDEFRESRQKIDDSEHNILTHVLTLLGVFSAIIVTIMSVVITTSSWLNNTGQEGLMSTNISILL